MFASTFEIEKPSTTVIAGAPFGHDARVLADIAVRARKTPVVYVAQDDVKAAVMAETLAFFAPSVEVLSFPSWDCLPYDRVSPQSDISGQRLTVLSRLTHPLAGPTVVITTVSALTQKTLPPEALEQVSLNVAVGDSLAIEKLRRFLAASGFVNASTVREQGEFAVRGGIVDLFPPGYEAPVRLDFFGDEIEALRQFDAMTQVTTGTVDRLCLQPICEVLLDETTIAQFRSGYRALFGAVTDTDPLYAAISAGQKFPGMEHWLGLFYPRLVGILDYLPSSPVVFEAQADEALKARFAQVEDFYQARQSLYESALRSAKKKKDPEAQASTILYKPTPVGSLYFDEAHLNEILEKHAKAFLVPFAPADVGKALDAQGRRGRDFADARTGAEGDLYAAFRAYAAENQAINRRVVLACYSNGSAERLSGLLKAHKFDGAQIVKSWDEARKLDPKLVGIVILGLEHGFTAPDIAFVTEQDILGDRLTRQAKKRRTSSHFQLELSSLSPGDFVVHAEHGIGRYEGLETIHALGVAHDCVKLIYDGGDKLFLPVENLDVLTRYSSAEGGAVLDKLGGVAWQARKARVKKRLKDMADELLKIAAQRSLQKGELVQAPESALEEFAARFPYNETEDQDRAIDAVLEDMASGKPMDRLVCGDVGFGKTEVALRAAFAAVQSGLQVAVVVPTTLLARQHYNNFITRFQSFPVRIGQLSRMVSAKEVKLTKEEMKAGTVDIVVGTHALLSQDIGFQRLGLLIIDEEQHFGVKQKERIKNLRADVHVLTLTATPIPRTLQLALSGVRELSLITTPPVDRLAVRTFVLPFDPLVIREALMREHYRGGQSFYVCPHIEDLDKVAAELRELVPEVKFVTAHGRMTPTQLDDIMTAFDARQYDVLLATNIIESGLDIPNANTMIVHRSDLFGLAQLYQLRGRVGRGKLRGYTYLTYAQNAMLAPTALQRLEVLQSLDQLGAGFQLASHDMDIRGAGNLLGEEQSGHVREVGVELYQQMLEDAVAAARAGGSEEATEDRRWIPQINIGMSVLIPESYVADLNVRLGLYRRLADGAEAADIEAIAAEMIDRFGALPSEVENLLQTVEIKGLCRKANVDKVDAGPTGAVLSFHNNQMAHPEKLVAWIGQQMGTVRVRPDQKLALIRGWSDPALRLAGVKKVLEELAEINR